MDMNGEESEDSDDSEDSQTETADTKTAVKDSSRKEVEKQVTSDEAKASTQNVGQQPLISHLFRGKENSPFGSPIGSQTSSPLWGGWGIEVQTTFQMPQNKGKRK